MSAFSRRSIGAAYLFYFLAAICGEVLIAHGFVVAGRAVGVLANISYAALTLLFYKLFRPVDARVSAVAACFGLAGCVLATLGVFHHAPHALNPLFFFGCYCIAIGYLIMTSEYVPRIFGVLMAVAGLGWLAFVTPQASEIAPYVKVVGFLSEAALMLWLLAFGVALRPKNVPARRAATP